MERLIIVGAGGFGREVHAWAAQTWGHRPDWEFGGFLDDNPSALTRFPSPTPGWVVLGSPAAWQPSPDERFLVAVGSPTVKRRLATLLSSRGAKWATLVHPSAIVGARVRIGEGSILCPGVVVTCDVRLGRWVSLNVSTAVGHDAVLEDYVQTSAFCDITGGTHLGEEAFLGSRVSVLPGQVVEKGATVGAGSVVVRRVKAGTTVFGVPARELPV